MTRRVIAVIAASLSAAGCGMTTTTVVYQRPGGGTVEHRVFMAGGAAGTTQITVVGVTADLQETQLAELDSIGHASVEWMDRNRATITVAYDAAAWEYVKKFGRPLVIKPVHVWDGAAIEYKLCEVQKGRSAVCTRLGEPGLAQK